MEYKVESSTDGDDQDDLNHEDEDGIIKGIGSLPNTFGGGHSEDIARDIEFDRIDR